MWGAAARRGEGERTDDTRRACEPETELPAKPRKGLSVDLLSPYQMPSLSGMLGNLVAYVAVGCSVVQA